MGFGGTSFGTSSQHDEQKYSAPRVPLVAMVLTNITDQWAIIRLGANHPRSEGKQCPEVGGLSKFMFLLGSSAQHGNVVGEYDLLVLIVQVFSPHLDGNSSFINVS